MCDQQRSSRVLGTAPRIAVNRKGSATSVNTNGYFVLDLTQGPCQDVRSEMAAKEHMLFMRLS